MNEIEQKKVIQELRDNMYVNKELKNELRRDFIDRIEKRKIIVKWKGFAAAVACILIVTMTTFNLTPVSAKELNITNYLSVMDLPVNVQSTPSEYDGKIYIPVAGEGLYVYSISGLTKVYEGDIQGAKISPNGELAAISKENSIVIYNLKTKEIINELRGDANNYYEDPQWNPDNSSIMFTKRDLVENDQKEFIVLKNSVVKMDILSGKLTELAIGEHGSFVKSKNAVAFQREDKIYYKNLKSNVESLVDDGSAPSVSPDGKYITYTKSVVTYKEVSPNIKIETGLQDVWIVDTENLLNKKKITNNITLKFISEDEWLKSIKPSNELQILSYNGRYGYVQPYWSSNSKSIYVLRRDYSITDRPSHPELIRVDLDKHELSPKETVVRYIQAVASNDIDYASSLDPSYVQDRSEEEIMSSDILEEGKENGQQFVDAQIQWKTKDGKANRIEKVRFFLAEKEGVFLIKGREIIDTAEIIYDSESVSLVQKSGVKKLFRFSDLNEALNLNVNRFTAASYSGTNDVFIVVQDGDKQNIIKCDISTKKFILIDSIDNSSPLTDITVSSSGKYIAFEYGDKERKIFICSSDGSKKVDVTKSFGDSSINEWKINSWNEDSLIVKGRKNNINIYFEYKN